MSLIDLEINREIRKVMVRHWVDIGRLGIHSANGKATLRGNLTRLQGAMQELDASTVDRIFYELRRIQSVQHLSMQLENWIQCDGAWKKIESASAERSTISESGEGTKSYTIGKGGQPPTV
jgi:hypothetical protein